MSRAVEHRSVRVSTAGAATITALTAPFTGDAVRVRKVVPPWAGLVGAMALCGVPVVIAQLLTLHTTLLDADEATYASIAGLMNAGGSLYADGGIDNKPPVIYWIYSILFRAGGLYNLFAVHLFKIAVALGTAALIGFNAGKLGGLRAGLFGFALYGVFTAAGYPAMAAANTEVFMMLPAAGAMLAAATSRWRLAGALVALAAFVKQTAVLDLLVVMWAATAVADHRLRRAAVVGAATGFALGCLLILACLWSQRSLGGFWWWGVLSLATYGSTAWGSERWMWLLQNSVLPWLQVTPLLWVPTCIALIRRSFWHRIEGRLMWVWLAAACVQVLIGGQLFPHYFIAVVGPLSVLAAAEIDSWLRQGGASTLAATISSLILSAPALSSILNDYRDGGALSPGAGRVGAYVKAHTRSTDRVLVYGNDPTLYVASERLPSTRLVGFLRGYPRGSPNRAGLFPENWDTGPDVWALLEEDQSNHPAALILDTSTRDGDFRSYPLIETFPRLARIVQDRYRVVAVVDGVTIYERLPG
jgi:hypothetical protein